MNRQVMCDRCGNDFTTVESLCDIVEDGDLQVQYFSCPFCGLKYQILTTDSRMRELIQKRKRLQVQLTAARRKKFREKTIHQYVQEIERIKVEQELMLPKLKARGNQILHVNSKLGVKEHEK